MSRRNRNRGSFMSDPTPDAEGVVDESAPAESAEAPPAEPSAPAPPEPDFSVRLFATIEELDEARASVARLQGELAATQIAKSSVEDTLRAARDAHAAETTAREEQRLALSNRIAELEVALASAQNDATFANGQVAFYHAQVTAWREALKALTPLVAYVEGKGASVPDHGVAMNLGLGAFISFGDIRKIAGIFRAGPPQPLPAATDDTPAAD